MGLRHDVIPSWALAFLLAWIGLGVFLLAFRGGGGRGVGQEEDAIAKAVDTTMAVPGARVSFRGGAVSGGGHVAINGAGVLNNETDRAFFRMTYSASDLGPKRQGADTVLDGIDGYIRSAELSAEYGTKKPWMFIQGGAIQEEAERLGLQEEATSTVDAMLGDPTQLLAALLSLEGPVSESGPEQVRGVTTTRYSTTVDYQEYLEQAEAGATDPALDALMGTVTGTNSDRRVDVWIDEENLVRRQQVKLDEGRSGGVYVQDYFDFGVQSDVAVPPRSRAYDLTPRFIEQLQESDRQ